MCYIKAKDVLPLEVIELIQQYVDGEYLYIPQKEERRLGWGTKTKIREEMNQRNTNIYTEFLAGESKETLAHNYCLSQKSIERIILQQKRKR
ncbi:hypothetical protein GMB51_08750 [Turicibacter sanguinis]|nr:hypothetical protein [Turicibacter sanguinis]MTN50958.1 hypothetical protein [Turicibacter sanguinis]MTN54198.1 hypothetical protein [Turicibacter sanguinis]MTN57331.1 hypothetical protein [Turicibacter sanguinis]MTN60396.1 hypothetical protein [Turicibacter sanguinis]